MSDDLVIGNCDAHARQDTLIHLNFAVVVVSDTRLYLILLAESWACAFVLECHHEPLVVLVGVSEYKYDDAVEVLLDTNVFLI